MHPCITRTDTAVVAFISGVLFTDGQHVHPYITPHAATNPVIPVLSVLAVLTQSRDDTTFAKQAHCRLPRPTSRAN